ncbi:MAG TPA: DUF4244 domain-containing protein [Actinomycetota bacterium]|nr:DUF4244 domain-containing protein [Actinomycetota bacterium]
MIRLVRERVRALAARVGSRVECACEAGQSTTEYTLVILVAATIALLMLNWAQGGAIVGFFDNIFSRVTSMFSPS